MKLSSLLICADEAAVQVIDRVLQELGIRVELCDDPTRAALRLAQARFDLLIIDCEKRAQVMTLLDESRDARQSEGTMVITIVAGQESIRELFALGVNFVLYKPVSYERAVSSLRAAQGVLFRDKRRKVRANLHTQATIDYANVQSAKATLVNLGEDGLSVNLPKQVPPACKVYFQFQLPGQHTSVRLSGQVIWQDWNGRAGIQFVDVPQASRKILQGWLRGNLPDSPQQLEPEPLEVETSIKPKDQGALGIGSGKKSELNANSNDAVKSGASSTKKRLKSDPGNRRVQDRYECRLGAEVYQQGSSVKNYCHLSDLGPGGCYLEMPLAFPAGSPIEIVVRTHEMKLHLSGTVKSSHPGYGMGVSFKLNTSAQQNGVQQLIDFVAAAAESAT